MLPSIGILIAIVILGAVSYLTSAWFGVKASNFDRSPAHYAHLRRKLAKAAKERARVEADDLFT